ncbi:hypothetical protein BH09SUM1_BH09SUM1_26260 [soil metagenome]
MNHPDSIENFGNCSKSKMDPQNMEFQKPLEAVD